MTTTTAAPHQQETDEQRAKRRWLAFVPWNIGGNENPYLRRWFLIPWNRRFNVYLHKFLRSDDDRALHDHPFDNVSILLRGSYLEHTPEGTFRRSAPAFVRRTAEQSHRIELIDGKHVWTLFVTGRKVREWGFHCEKSWRHWREFMAKNGCGEP